MHETQSLPRLFAALALVCFASLTRGDAVAAQDTIKVGIVLPLTGSQALFGEMEKESFALALEEINQGGGVRGRPLEFVIEDDRGRPEIGAAAAEKLIDEGGVVMLGGGYSSAVTLSVAEVAQRRAVPFLVNTGAADAITERGWDHVFRMNPPSSEYVASVMSFLTEVVEPRTAAIIHEESAFGQSQSEAFEAACRELGIPIVVHESYAAPAGTASTTATEDFKLWHVTDALSQLRRFKPDVVYMVAYLLDANLLMTQARALGWSPKVYIGGGAGFTLPKFYELTREAADHVYTVTLWDRSLPYPRADVYAAKFETRYGRQPDYHGAEAYAAAYVIADVLARADSLEPEDVRRALAETRLTTVFGPVEFVSYDGKTNQNRLHTYLGQWIDGRLELVWPQAVAQADYVFPVP
jgi:branched-chain amino acid transport system substrate-binding protein